MKRIMTVLSWLESSEHHGEEKIIAGAVRWSLTCNARQHKRVLKICQQESINQPALKKPLSEIIEKATTPSKKNAPG